MDESEPLPVCTLFNQGADDGDSGADIFNGPPSSSKKPVVFEAVSVEPSQISNMPPASEPAVCDIFKSTSSSEDLFTSMLATTSSSKNDVSRPEVTIERADDVFSLDTSSDMTRIHMKHELSDIFKDAIADDKSDESEENISPPKSPIKDQSALDNTDIMASILISDDSGDNISNISFDQSLKQDGSAGDQNNKAIPSEVLQADNNCANNEVESKNDNKDSGPTPKEVKNDLKTNIFSTPPSFHPVSSETKPLDPVDTEVKDKENSSLEDMEEKKTEKEEVINEPTETSTAPLASGLFTSTSGSSSFDHKTESSAFATIADDAFSSALSTSETDRRQDAWIPGKSTAAVLAAVAQSQKRIKLEASHLSRPGLATSESLGDPVKAILARHRGIELASKRVTLSAESVTLDKNGLEKLITTGNFRAAVDLCSKVLTDLGQGFGKATQASTHSPQSVQWWHVRFALLIRLKLFEMVETELSQFGSFDSADLYYGFYPDVYPGRKGSMVPFSLRLLHADFPRHINKPYQALERFYAIRTVCKKVIDNLESNKSEDGTPVQLKAEDRNASLKLWNERKTKVLHYIGNTLFQLREYHAAITTYDEIIAQSSKDEVSLHSGLGRLLLQLGDVRAAQHRFAQVEKLAANDSKYRTQLEMNRGFLYLGANNWPEALQQFSEVLKHDPTNIEALNNKSVCLLYLCRLKEAIAVQETAAQLQEDAAKQGLTSNRVALENSLSNLVTLYELESSKSLNKKQALLQGLALTHGDGFNVACLKM
ncbi:trafficking protein particle complex subunit 12-like [Clavelina lepadiformis]|uniref:trafficking protein particle complex subunit 12-like n=1 Tax=Clavelina lepadiformis TaxID=159417 RepID=UPI0040413E08